MANSALTYDKVKTHYSSLAREKEGENAEHIKNVALSFGYDAEDLAAIPEGANLGVSCGNPLAVAGLKAVSIVSFCDYTFHKFPKAAVDTFTREDGNT
jgi:hypothetical protein